MKRGAVLLALASLVLIKANGYVNMRTGVYGNSFVFMVSVIMMMIGLLFICQMLNEKFRIPRYVISIGQDGIVYTCLNQTVIYPLKYLVQCFSIPPIISKPLTLIITMAVL